MVLHFGFYLWQINWLMLLCYSRHDFYTIVDLPEGEHQYKYFVDHEWLCDDKEVCILFSVHFVLSAIHCVPNRKKNNCILLSTSVTSTN